MKQLLLSLLLLLLPAPALAQQVVRADGTPVYRPMLVRPVAADPINTIYGDLGGFYSWLNLTRARHGLAMLQVDPALVNDAAINSGIQARANRLSHSYMGSARRQNSGWGSLSAMPASWYASPAHRSALLDPSARFVGLAGVGAYWTINLR